MALWVFAIPMLVLLAITIAFAALALRRPKPVNASAFGAGLVGATIVTAVFIMSPQFDDLWKAAVKTDAAPLLVDLSAAKARDGAYPEESGTKPKAIASWPQWFFPCVYIRTGFAFEILCAVDDEDEFIYNSESATWEDVSDPG